MSLDENCTLSSSLNLKFKSEVVSVAWFAAKMQLESDAQTVGESERVTVH